MLKKRITIMFSLVGLILVVAAGASFAYMRTSSTQTDSNRISTLSCLNVSISGDDSINIANGYPMRDEEGVTTNPYLLSITNDCNSYVELNIGLELLSASTIPASYLKVSINQIGGTPVADLLGDNTTMSALNNGTAYLMMTDGLDKSATNEYDFRLWADYTTPNTYENAGVSAKIIVSATVKTPTNKNIYTIEDLVLLAQDVNNGNDRAGMVIKLLRDLDFTDDDSYEDPDRIDFGDLNGDGTTTGIKAELTGSGKGFTPIGKDTNKPFKGTFNGNNHTISNLNISDSETISGLFGVVDGGIIQDLTISGSVDSSDDYSTGGLIGETNNTVAINNCHVDIDVEQSGDASVGGLVGANNGTLTISGSSSEGDITGSSAGTGGLVGTNNYRTTISTSSNAGTITDGAGVGGLVGETMAYPGTLYISDSYNTQSVSSSINDIPGMSVGGLLGRVFEPTTTVYGSSEDTVNISNSYNTGNVTISAAASTTDKIAGGIIGLTLSEIELNNVYNTGVIQNTDTTYTASSTNSYIALGGLIGCTSINHLVRVLYSHNEGNVTSGNVNGGIIGLIWEEEAASAGGIPIIDELIGSVLVYGVYNAGNVSSSLKIGTVLTVSGGIIGQTYASTVNTSSPTIYVRASYNTGAVSIGLGTAISGINSAGGILGKHESGSVQISASYNAGNITNSNSYAGGITGHGKSTITIGGNHVKSTVTGRNTTSYSYAIGYFTSGTASFNTNYYLSTISKASNQSGSGTSKTAALFNGADNSTTSVTYLLNNSTYVKTQTMFSGFNLREGTGKTGKEGDESNDIVIFSSDTTRGYPYLSRIPILQFYTTYSPY